MMGSIWCVGASSLMRIQAPYRRLPLYHVGRRRRSAPVLARKRRLRQSSRGAGLQLRGRLFVTSFRFVHTADIHLDSPLKGLSGYDGAVADRIRTAGREAFDALVGAAITAQAAFVVIAGDLYDGDWRDYQTGVFFARQMGRLARAGVRVFVLHGNHDAESQITRRLTPPDNVRIFSARKPETILLEDLGAALHGQSFAQRDVTANLALSYPKPLEGVFNIGVLHTGLGGLASGAGGHANYAPCALDDLVNKGYDYWALGHVHKSGVLRERPHVVFPGNIQGRHIRESGPKGAYLVTVEDGEVAGLEFFAADAVRWALVPVDAGGCRQLDEAVERMGCAIAAAMAAEADGRLLACRVELRGRVEIHGALLASAEKLLGEARAAAAALGDHAVWIERVAVATEPLRAAGGEGGEPLRDDALGAVQRMLAEAGGDAALRECLEADIGELVRRLPPEAREGIEDPLLSAAVKGDYAALADGAGAWLAALLAAEA